MDPKKNALNILQFQSPEKIVCGVPCEGVAYFGASHESYDRSGGDGSPVGTVWTDVWGVVWHKELQDVMAYPRQHPLADFPSALRTWRLPDPADERVCGQIYSKAATINRAERFVIGSHRETLWEKAYMLVGMETLMMAFHEEPAAVRELLSRIMDFDLAIAEHYLKVGVEFVGMGDDLGTQSGLLLSPAILQEFLVPQYRRLFDLYKRHGVRIAFHSCGHITPVLPMFMDLGVDLLNPIQASANDLDEVRRITQGRMALEGGVRSDVVVSGPPSAIRAEVARRIVQLGRHGGYFCNFDQWMPWPAAHHRAMVDAVAELGHYPLDIDRLTAVAQGRD